MSSKIKVHAGDFFTQVKGSFIGGSFYLKSKKHFIFEEKIQVKKKLKNLELATEENVKKLSSAVGASIAGAILLGPVGLLAGLLLGGKKQEVTFIAEFEDGRWLMATTSKKTYVKIQKEYLKKKRKG